MGNQVTCCCQRDVFLEARKDEKGKTELLKKVDPKALLSTPLDVETRHLVQHLQQMFSFFLGLCPAGGSNDRQR